MASIWRVSIFLLLRWDQRRLQQSDKSHSGRGAESGGPGQTVLWSGWTGTVLTCTPLHLLTWHEAYFHWLRHIWVHIVTDCAAVASDWTRHGESHSGVCRQRWERCHRGPDHLPVREDTAPPPGQGSNHRAGYRHGGEGAGDHLGRGADEVDVVSHFKSVCCHVVFQIQRFRDSKKNTTEEENEIKEASHHSNSNISWKHGGVCEVQQVLIDILIFSFSSFKFKTFIFNSVKCTKCSQTVQIFTFLQMWWHVSRGSVYMLYEKEEK